LLSVIREARELIKEGIVGGACGKIEIGVTHYDAALVSISDGVLEMMSASRNCFWRRDRNRASDNLDLLKSSASKIRDNMDKGIALYDQYCR
jgi:serine phosphatase RsbU (regulator of sigma subunit)